MNKLLFENRGVKFVWISWLLIFMTLEARSHGSLDDEDSDMMTRFSKGKTSPSREPSSEDSPTRTGPDPAEVLKKTADYYQEVAKNAEGDRREALERIAAASRNALNNWAKEQKTDRGILSSQILQQGKRAEVKVLSDDVQGKVADGYVSLQIIGTESGEQSVVNFDSQNFDALKKVTNASQRIGNSLGDLDTGALLALAMDSQNAKPYVPKDAPEARKAEDIGKTRDALVRDSASLTPSATGESGAIDPLHLLNPEQRDQFVSGYVSDAQTGLGIHTQGGTDVSSSPLYSSAPPEIRDRSQLLFNEIVRNRASGSPFSRDLRPLTQLLGDEKFQNFAERTLGTNRLREVNLDVAAAMVGADTRNGPLLLAAVAKSVAAAKATPFFFAASGTGLSTWPFKAGGSTTSSTLKMIEAAPEEWIEAARALGRAENHDRLAALERDAARYSKALARLELWLRELASLKASEYLKHVTHPFQAPDADALARARWRLELCFRQLAVGPGRSKIDQPAVEARWVRLMRHAQTQSDRLKAAHTADRELEAVRLAFADRVVAEDWRLLAKGNYNEARQAAGELVFLRGLEELADPTSRLHYAVSAAFEDIDRRRALKRPVLAQPAVKTPERRTASDRVRADALNFDDPD
jgi:hypothetical protein